MERLQTKVVSKPISRVCPRLANLDFHGRGQTELLLYGSIETASRLFKSGKLFRLANGCPW